MAVPVSQLEDGRIYNLYTTDDDNFILMGLYEVVKKEGADAVVRQLSPSRYIGEPKKASKVVGNTLAFLPYPVPLAVSSHEALSPADKQTPQAQSVVSQFKRAGKRRTKRRPIYPAS
jgi:hypothetical protein